ncbi:hypothetical protein NQ317_018376 [Molorchus minor]|uniref:Uncharacterized protein n=1 Tax=Molorchus minor TaxID=1323400 RepID=A0ABQ9JGH6_9CUCU|nr:hypothetical protein NQ317_018376 [Molorchus minor]
MLIKNRTVFQIGQRCRDKFNQCASDLVDRKKQEETSSFENSEHQMQRHLCALQLSMLCGSHRNLSADHLKALITALSLHYQHGYQSYGKNLLSTDLGPSDPYALMAAHVLYNLAQTEKSSDSVIIALILLENLLKNSPSNFHAKLLVIRLYHTLGCGLSAHDMYNNLDVKHLQLDSLGYITLRKVTNDWIVFPVFNSFDLTLKFFSSNYKDSSDHLTFSYKFGSFIKLDEFMDFRERLNNSLHYTLVAIDTIILSFMECGHIESLYSIDISPKDNKIEWESLRDNHDLSVCVSWDPEIINGPPEDWPDTKALFEQDVIFLKLRTSLLWSMSSAVDIAKSLDGTRQKHIQTLRNVLSEWKHLHDQTVLQNFVPINQGILTLPLPSRLHGALEAPYISLISTFFELLITLGSENIDKSSEIIKSIEEELCSLVKFVEDNTLKNKRKSMELVVNCVEIVCICYLICLLCNDVIKPLQGKKGKKKSGDTRSRDFLHTVAWKLKDDISIISDTLQQWADSSTTDDINSKFEALNLSSSQNVVENVLSSYNIANKEIQTVLKSKIKVLTSLTG